MKSHSRSIFNVFPLLALVASLLGGALTFTPAHAVTGQIHVNSAGDYYRIDESIRQRPD